MSTVPLKDIPAPNYGVNGQNSPTDGAAQNQKITGVGNSTLDTLEIPDNIDPVLLKLWLQREKAQIEANEKSEPTESKSHSLSLVFAAYLSVLTMILVVLLGMINATPPPMILQKAAFCMICFYAVGYVVGFITENCVRESARELVKEVVMRSSQEPPPTESTSIQ